MRSRRRDHAPAAGALAWQAMFVLAMAYAGCARSCSHDDEATAVIHGPFPRQTLANTEVRRLARSANGREYQLHIGLPDSYQDDPIHHYPVLYLCDAYWDFPLVRSIASGLVVDRAMPEIIIVGLGYPSDSPDYGRLRRWDLTPVEAVYEGAALDGPSGHAKEFLSVIANEVVPLVDREYRTNRSYRVLAGSSLAGLFSLYAMLARPGLFTAHIAASPAAQWADDWLLQLEEEFHKSGKLLRGRLFLTSAEEDIPTFLEATKRFDARLRTRDLSNLRYEFRIVEGERHAGTKPESYNRGLRFAFAPLAPEPSYP
jgi:predicted alpha/beta superfamily hydrolase